MFALREGNYVNYFESTFLADFGARAIITCRSDNFKSRKKFKKRLYKQLDINYNNVIQPRQIHSSSVFIIKQGEKYNKKCPYPADAVITGNNKIVLQCLFADCVPIFFYHPGTDVRAIAHSGWKGTGKAIAANVLRQLMLYYSIDPGEVYIQIGPAISQKYYEIDEKVYEYYSHHLPNLMSKRGEELFKKNNNSKGNKYFLDLKLANYHILNRAQADSRKIHISELCTYSNPRLYSYRKEGEQAGRMVALLLLNKEKRWNKC